MQVGYSGKTRFPQKAAEICRVHASFYIFTIVIESP